MDNEEAGLVSHALDLYASGDARGAAPKQCILRSVLFDLRPKTSLELCVFGALFLDDVGAFYCVLEGVGVGYALCAGFKGGFGDVGGKVGGDVGL